MWAGDRGGLLCGQGTEEGCCVGRGQRRAAVWAGDRGGLLCGQGTEEGCCVGRDRGGLHCCAGTVCHYCSLYCSVCSHPHQLLSYSKCLTSEITSIPIVLSLGILLDASVDYVSNL